MATFTLTDRQKAELNVAIYEYLLSHGEKYKVTSESFREEAGIPFDVELGKAVLEKKWTSVIRLQKRLMELETKLEQLHQQRTHLTEVPSSSQVGDTLVPDNKLLPKPPARGSLSGHRAPVTSVATHPVFSMIASASEDTTIRLWDHETNQYERTLKGHTGAVTSVSFDTKGTRLVSASTDTTIKLWDLNSYMCVKTIKGHDHTVSQVKFIFYGLEEHLASCSRDNTIKLWNLNTGYCVRTFTGHTDWVKTIAISLENKFIASGGHDQAIMIWSVSDGSLVQSLRGHEHVVECLCFGRKVVDVSASGSGASNPNESDFVTPFKNEKNYLVSGSRDRTVRLWDTATGVCDFVLNSHENWVRCVLFHPSFKYVISCSDDKSIRVFETKEGRCVRTISDAHSHFVTCLAMSATYPIVISGSVDRTVSVWQCY